MRRPVDEGHGRLAGPVVAGAEQVDREQPAGPDGVAHR
jgi:hypothetical protein